MRLLLVDNYDSFTYNLYQLLTETGCNQISVIKNDNINPDKLADFDKIVFSPGPGIPSEVPIMNEILNICQNTKSILGVCLGHQSIGCFYGATLKNIPHPQHGIASVLQITDASEKLFNDMNGEIIVGRYHSWAIEEATLPECLTVTSKADDGCIMSVSHSRYDVKGVQFHPESYITVKGLQIIRNWLR